MRNNLFAALLLIALPVTSLFAQQSEKISVAKPKQVISEFERNNASFLEKNKALLADFDEKKIQLQLKQKGVSLAAQKEIIIGKKIKHIQSKLHTAAPNISANISNKALAACDNIGFELGNFTNWDAGTGELTGLNWGLCPNPPIAPSDYAPGVILGVPNENSWPATTSRQTILTDPNRFDTIARDPQNGNYMIPYLAPGGSGVSVRLGNASTGAETEKLKYRIDVNTGNFQVQYKYAIVYQNPSHPQNNQPFFQARILDSLGDPLSGQSCGVFCYFADASSPDFITLQGGTTFNPFSFDDIQFKTWSDVSFDLSPFVGQTVYVEFTTGDCSQSGHFGYAYIDAVCGGNKLTVSICPNSDTAIVHAPLGYSSYEWQDTLGNVLGNEDSLIVVNPVFGDHFIAFLGSNASGTCLSTLDAYFDEYTEVPVTTSVLNLVCNGVTVGNATAIVDQSVIPPPYTYQWFNSNGQPIPNSNNAVLPTTTGGTFWVTVTSQDGCSNFLPDTAVVSSQQNYSHVTTQVASNTCLFTPVQLEVITTPPGLGYTYEWTPSKFLNSDTIAAPLADIYTPGHYVYYITITGSDGCQKHDSVVFTVQANYPPDATAFGNAEYTETYLCHGDTAQLGVTFGPGTPGICGIGPVCTGPVKQTQIGMSSSTSNTTSTYPAPFGSFYQNTKQQYIFHADELLAAGIKGGLINGIGFKVNGISSPLNNNYTVKMGCINQIEFDPTNLQFIDTLSLVTVYNPKQTNTVIGWNTLDFDQSYAWDGISNLLIETCTGSNNFALGQNSISPYTSTSFNSCMFRRNDVLPNTICSDILISPATQGGVSTKRPNIMFHTCGYPADTVNVSYKWIPSDGLSNDTLRNPIASPSITTNYSLVITDKLHGCIDTSQFKVVLPPNAGLSADPAEGPAPLAVNFTNSSDTSFTTFLWNFADGAVFLATDPNNTAHNFEQAGEYNVMLIGTSAQGCTDTATALVRVLTSELNVPNIFTPNGDAENNEFKINSPGIESFSGVIFDRWGKKVFEWSDPNKGWDGKNAKDGVYYYVIKATGVDGHQYDEKGNVTLLR
ncbi:MAG: gliding motility-associated C-terminal domain-containing protein [Bacteroidetes bacterium]|nr:gliding motility-associated C-terminal domain-containing protein [Bacteroidota bacterium]